MDEISYKLYIFFGISPLSDNRDTGWKKDEGKTSRVGPSL